jgi:hypothetical protein
LDTFRAIESTPLIDELERVVTELEELVRTATNNQQLN